MALSLTSLIEALDKREIQKLARQYVTTDVLPMGEIQRWLEQRWRPEATDLLAPGSITNTELSKSLVRTAAVRVIGGGGSTYTLAEHTDEVASVSGIATGQCRITLNVPSRGSNSFWAHTEVEDNGGWASGYTRISSSPITIDTYISLTTTGALTNRTFSTTIHYLAA